MSCHRSLTALAYYGTDTAHAEDV